MKINIPKKWFQARAHLEEGEIGAGVPPKFMSETNENVYLVLVKWPNGTEGLLFPRPGNVPIADTMEQGEKDFEKAKGDLEAVSKLPKFKGTAISLVKMQRVAVVMEVKL